MSSKTIQISRTVKPGSGVNMIGKQQVETEIPESIKEKENFPIVISNLRNVTERGTSGKPIIGRKKCLSR